MSDAKSAQWITLAALLAIGASACRGSSRADPGVRPAESSGLALGAYEFVARLPDGSQMEGQFAILRDTIIVESSQALCRGVGYQRSGAGWTCQGVSRYNSVFLSINAHNPRRSGWAITEEVRRQRRICVRYVVTPQGQRTNQCADWQNEVYTVPQRRTGVLEVSPRGSRDTLAVPDADA